MLFYHSFSCRGFFYGNKGYNFGNECGIYSELCSIEYAARMAKHLDLLHTGPSTEYHAIVHQHRRINWMQQKAITYFSNDKECPRFKGEGTKNADINTCCDGEDFDSCNDNCIAFAMSSSSCWLDTTLGFLEAELVLLRLEFEDAPALLDEKSIPSFFN